MLDLEKRQGDRQTKPPGANAAGVKIQNACALLDGRFVRVAMDNHGDSRGFSGGIIDGDTTNRSSWDLWASASMANGLGLSVGKLELEDTSGRHACVQDFHTDRSSRQWICHQPSTSIGARCAR